MRNRIGASLMSPHTTRIAYCSGVIVDEETR